MDTTALYERIKSLNKRDIVTVDTLLEGHGYEKINEITDGIKKLRDLGLVTISSIKNRGRFETEIIPRDGYIYHEPKKESKKSKIMRTENLEEDISEELPKKEKAVIQKVRRKV